MTAQGQPPARRRFEVPARWRIIAWILAVMTAGLASVIVVVDARLHTQVDEQANNQVNMAIREFHKFASDGRQGTPPGDTKELLHDFLQLRYPPRGKVLYGFTAGDPEVLTSRGPDVPAAFSLDDDPALSELVKSQPAGVTETEYGTIRWGHTEVMTPEGASGQLVVLMFTEPMSQDVGRTTRLLIIVSAITLLLSGVVAWLVAGQILRPIRMVRSTAAEITERDLTRRIPVRGSDDVADLATTFNAMLDRLETAFATEQRFVDDAGHELRTPITIIRGHLELMGDDPQERRATIALVTQELDRMSRIVTDLLLLAKAERPDFVQLTPGVDVADMTIELDNLVAPLGDRRWGTIEVAEGECALDRQRVIQAVLQLAQNAVQHTRPGDRIDLASSFVARSDGQRVLELTVTDDGPGIPEAAQDRIFRRFAHGHGDTTVPAPGHRAGAGLGLAIVSAIAEGHGGGVDVTNVAGRGARFRLWLPAGPAHEPSVQQTRIDEAEGSAGLMDDGPADGHVGIGELLDSADTSSTQDRSRHGHNEEER